MNSSKEFIHKVTFSAESDFFTCMVGGVMS